MEMYGASKQRLKVLDFTSKVDNKSKESNYETIESENKHEISLATIASSKIGEDKPAISRNNKVLLNLLHKS
jgi:hypothetical protein